MSVANDVTLLGLCQTELADRGWVFDKDEAHFPRFRQRLGDKDVSFCYQLVMRDAVPHFMFIAQVTSPHFCNAYGVIADTKFNDVGLGFRTFQKAAHSPNLDDVLGLTEDMTAWARALDVAGVIAAYTVAQSDLTHENFKHLAALAVQGKTEILSSYLDRYADQSTPFGRVPLNAVKRAVGYRA